MTKKNKILHISASNFDVAGVYILSIHEELKKRGYETRILTPYIIEPTKEIISYYSPIKFFLKKYAAKIKRRIFPKADINPEYCFHSLSERKDYIPAKKILKKVAFSPDIITISFCSNFINAKTIYELKQLTDAQILWIVPDASPFTGACHYSWGCTHLKAKCINCPGCNSPKLQNKIHENFMFKEKYLAKLDIKWMGNSWVKKYLEDCPFTENSTISLVHVAVPEYDFAADEIEKYKKELDLPHDKVIFFFGAVYMNEKRKGGNLLLEAVDLLKDNEAFTDNAFFVFAGNNGDEFLKDVYSPYKYLAKLSVKEINRLFCVVDFVVSPSIEDAGPMMINQALMASCPVIALPQGGALDLIKNKYNGFLASDMSSKKLSECLLEAVSARSKFEKMRVNAKNSAKNNVAVDKVVDTIVTTFS